jgi:hypothetical protein
VGIWKVPARDFILEIDAGYGTTSPNDWTAIGGLMNLTPAPNTVEADTADNDSAGVSEHMVMERGVSFSIAGHYLEDMSNGDRDPGQEAVEALATLVGVESNGAFRLTSPGSTQVTFLASAEVTSGGGGHNDPANWSATIHVSGAVT